MEKIHNIEERNRQLEEEVERLKLDLDRLHEQVRKYDTRSSVLLNRFLESQECLKELKTNEIEQKKIFEEKLEEILYLTRDNALKSDQIAKYESHIEILQQKLQDYEHKKLPVTRNTELQNDSHDSDMQMQSNLRPLFEIINNAYAGSGFLFEILEDIQKQVKNIQRTKDFTGVIGIYLICESPLMFITRALDISQLQNFQHTKYLQVFFSQKICSIVYLSCLIRLNHVEILSETISKNIIG